MHNIKIKRLNPDAIIPHKSTPGAVAYDIAIPDDYIALPGRHRIPLGFAIELPDGCEAKIETRSGIAAFGMQGCELDDFRHAVFTRPYRYDCDVITGKIDPDYRGEVAVIIHSHDRPFVIPKGYRIAQMTIYKVQSPSFILVDELNETERADGGFGHTGLT